MTVTDQLAAIGVTLSLLAAASAAHASSISAPEGSSKRFSPVFRTKLPLPESTAAAVRVSVRPDGRVTKCRVESFVGSERNAAALCKSFGRVRLNPATNAAGEPVHGVLRTFVSFQFSGPNQLNVRELEEPTDFSVDAPSLPKGASRAQMQLTVLVGAEGRIETCEGDAEVSAVLVEVACRQARLLPLLLEVDEEGRAVPYVTTVAVALRSSTGL